MRYRLTGDVESNAQYYGAQLPLEVPKARSHTGTTYFKEIELVQVYPG